MTRRLVIVTSTVLFGASAMAMAAGSANDRVGPADGGASANVEARVPLPVARPQWIERTAARGPVPANAVQPSRLLAEGAAGTDGGLKSGSAEALAVQLEGAKVVSSEGSVVGDVERLLVRPGAGKQAVVNVGGFLGIGGSQVLMPADTLTPSGKGMVRTQLTEQQIRSLPAYEK